MTDFEYPPTRTLTLGVARTQAAERAAELADTSDADGDSDGGDTTSQLEQTAAENQRDALDWAVREFGEDAEVTLRAYTATTRDRTLDTLRNDIMGDPGGEEISTWLVAAGVEDAPWLADKDIQSKAQRTGQLPPALVDWLDRELDDLNDLSEGN